MVAWPGAEHIALAKERLSLMCGICGQLMLTPEAAVAPALLKSMADTMIHRGPDDDGYYLSGPVGLGFRRLSIIDLNTGHQPISNEDGSVWVILNGEIYNYRDLRDELLAKGHSFATKTDTEVLVHLYEERGPRMLEALRGMFAFAIWDDRQRTLLLARDRIGIKPLYYYATDRFLSFASELKAILADPAVEREVDPAMIQRFLTFYYMPGEETLFRGIRKLPPGSYLLARNGRAEIKSYWSLSFERSKPAPTIRDAEHQFTELLQESVRLHMLSDVPVGILLSGGVDSTAMLSLATAAGAKPIRSFTVGFSSGVVDERPYARLASKEFGSAHHEITISPQEFRDFLPGYVWHMEEPVCEPPAIALYYVTKLARSHVKVLISGEGADEAFAGYSRYRNFLWLERLKRALGPARPAASAAAGSFARLVQSPKLALYARLINLPLERYYLSRTSHPFTFFNSAGWISHAREVAGLDGGDRATEPIRHLMSKATAYGVLEKMLYVDSNSWLPDDLLVKADKMAMANSIELRVPFLDHRVLEFAAALPANLKIRGLTTKYLAKKALSRRVPAEIIQRRKAGFPLPYESWLRRELKDWLREVLLDRETLARGHIQRDTLEQLLASELAGGYAKELFSLAVLEIWHRTFLSRSAAPAPSSAPVAAILASGR
jgi:asparagine synthase (glutamine-hydrolysing)